MEENTILAAGGVVVRGTGAGQEFLLVYRARYGDWTLPKGKLKRGETPEQAAVREVHEETGYSVAVTSFLGEVKYSVKGTPKTVQFWNMRAVGTSGGIQDQGEVQEVAWMPAQQALEKLDYALEKEILMRAIGK